ncbi:hypothetical protein [Armatimonas sp.]|uniref:hypothetical protein n=1 Tax=Armatimonas sp. TaxID=1872638 RepID=UPI003753CBC7
MMFFYLEYYRDGIYEEIDFSKIVSIYSDVNSGIGNALKKINRKLPNDSNIYIYPRFSEMEFSGGYLYFPEFNSLLRENNIEIDSLEIGIKIFYFLFDKLSSEFQNIDVRMIYLVE